MAQENFNELVRDIQDIQNEGNGTVAGFIPKIDYGNYYRPYHQIKFTLQVPLENVDIGTTTTMFDGYVQTISDYDIMIRYEYETNYALSLVVQNIENLGLFGYFQFYLKNGITTQETIDLLQEIEVDPKQYVLNLVAIYGYPEIYIVRYLRNFVDTISSIHRKISYIRASITEMIHFLQLPKFAKNL